MTVGSALPVPCAARATGCVHYRPPEEAWRKLLFCLTTLPRMLGGWCDGNMVAEVEDGRVWATIKALHGGHSVGFSFGYVAGRNGLLTFLFLALYFAYMSAKWWNMTAGVGDAAQTRGVA